MKAEIAGHIIKNAVTVPRKAFYEDTFVYVIADGVFDYRKVDVARIPRLVLHVEALHLGEARRGQLAGEAGGAGRTADAQDQH